MALITDISETEYEIKHMNLADVKPQSKTSFHKIIGHIEDILVDDDFHELQSGYLEKYWREFSNSEENKHCYMDIFKQYTSSIESFIEVYLKKHVQEFSMEIFLQDLEKRSNLEGEVFDVLLTLTDFSAFKEMFLEYKEMKEGDLADLSSAIVITPLVPKIN